MKSLSNQIYYIILAVLSGTLLLAGCGAPEQGLPDCTNDGTMLYFVGGPTCSTTEHVCNDALGKQHAKDCVIRLADGEVSATCMDSCSK